MTVDITFDGTTLAATAPTAIVRNIERQAIGNVRDQHVQMPGRADAWVFNEELGERVIKATLFLPDATAAALRTDVKAIAAWLKKDAPKKLIFSDESDRYWLAKVSQEPTPQEVGPRGELALEWLVSAYAYATSVSVEGPYTATDAVAHTFSISDAYNAFPIIEVASGGSGIVGGFILTVNGTTLTYTTTVAVSTTITLSSVGYSVTVGANYDSNLTGALDTANVSMSTVSGDFPILVPGSNSVTVDTADGTSTTVTITWRRRYI